MRGQGQVASGEGGPVARLVDLEPTAAERPDRGGFVRAIAARQHRLDPQHHLAWG